MIMEDWKEIGGHPGYYVSDLGNIRHDNHMIAPRYVSQSRKYQQVVIRGIQYYIHRLVAHAFIGNIATSYQVNHLDKDPSNNSLENLEICTPYENAQHARWPEWHATQTRLFI